MTIVSASILLVNGPNPYHVVRFDLSSKPVNVNSVSVKEIDITNPDGSTLKLDTSGMKVLMFPGGRRGRVVLDKVDVRKVLPNATFALALKVDDSSLQTTGAVIQDSEIVQYAATAIDTFNTKVVATKVGSDKDVLAGMDVAIPNGDSSKAQGSADISFHHEYGPYALLTGKLIDQLSVGATLKKGSTALADLRHFQIGAALQKNILLHDRDKIRILQEVISGECDKNQDPCKNAVVDANKLRRHVFTALFVDSGLSFEGDIKGSSIGNVSNFLFTADSRFISPNYASGDGYGAIRFQPISLETGYNVQNSDTPSAANHGLVRYKSGFEGTLGYNFRNIPLARLELSLNATERYLFLNENAYDPVTKAVTAVTKGSHYYAEGGLKLFFANTVWGRTGFQGSFKRGGLPPTYAETRAFTFGFIYETSDDSRELKAK